MNGSYPDGDALDTERLRHGDAAQSLVALDQATVAVDHDTKPILSQSGLEVKVAHIFHIEPIVIEIARNPFGCVQKDALVIDAQGLSLFKLFQQPGVVAAGVQVEAVVPDIVDKVLP